MKESLKILLVEDSAAFRGAVVQLLGVYHDCDEAADLASAKAAIAKNRYNVIVIDKGLPDGDGTELISEIKAQTPAPVVVVLTSDSDFSSVKHSIAKGADDYVIKTDKVIPDLLVRIPVAISRAAANRRLENLENQINEAFRYEIVGKSQSTMELRELVLELKGENANVLITGESGTGKELIARRLNAIEGEKSRPFVSLNCGAVSAELFESELFGHKRGAFTGATQDRIGKFEQAHGGDLFLDEIGEMSPSLQVKLLRAIQEGEITRVGDNRLIHVNCRIIAATNQNLEELIKAGKFREDLYHRLNVIRIETTPLRKKIEDLPDLTKLFVVQVGGANYQISDRAIRRLKDYDWPGNIRELRNVIERAAIQCRRRKSTKIDYDDLILPEANVSISSTMKKLEASLPDCLADLGPVNYREYFDTLEKEYFKSALSLAEGNVAEVSRRLRMSQSTVFKKLKDLGISTMQRKVFPRAPKRTVGEPHVKFDEMVKDATN